MKKFISIFMSLLIFTGIVPTFVSAQEITSENSYSISSSAEATNFFENVMNSTVWKETESRELRGEMLQLPEQMLKNLTTEALVEAVLEYPFFSDVFAFDDIQLGIDVLCNSFNGIEELSTREDNIDILISKYINEPVLTAKQANNSNQDNDIFRSNKIEILLAQPDIVGDLSILDASVVSETCIDKLNLKENSGLYSQYSEDMFFDLLGVDKNSKSLKETTQLALATQSSSVYTPNGTKVAVIVNKSEPLSQSEIKEINSIYDKNYPTAKRLRSASGKYNCHSYAWYSQSSSNNKWMNSPANYINDKSYTYGSIKPSEKMVYYSNSQIIHSAIIKTRSEGPSLVGFSDLVQVDSKWGSAGLYNHKGNNSPYWNTTSYSYFKKS